MTTTSPTQPLTSLLAQWDTPTWKDAKQAIILFLWPMFPNWARGALKSVPRNLKQRIDLDDLVSGLSIWLAEFLNRWNAKMAGRLNEYDEQQWVAYFHEGARRKLKRLIDMETRELQNAREFSTLDPDMCDRESNEVDHELLVDFFLDLETVVDKPSEAQAVKMKLEGCTHAQITQETGLSYKTSKKVIEDAFSKALAV